MYRDLLWLPTLLWNAINFVVLSYYRAFKQEIGPDEHELKSDEYKTCQI